MKSQLRLKSTFVLFMLILLAGLAVMLWFRYDSEIKQYGKLQHTLMQQQATQTAKDINNRIDFIRNQMSSISLDSSWLSDLDKFEQDIDVQKKMENRLKLYFPSMYTYSIVLDTGKQLGGDIESFIGKTCSADIKRVSTMFDPKIDFFHYEPYLHRKNGVAHFDVMIPVLIHDKKMVFFISFKANILNYVLKEHVISEHSSFIVRKDIPLLIEVSMDGVENNLIENDFLSADAVNNMVKKANVPNTRWEVVVLENTSFINEFKKSRLFDAGIIFTVFLLFWIALLWLGLRSQRRQIKLFSKLRHESQHDELTGLSNRRKLFSELEFALNDLEELNLFSVVLYLDLDGFKQVNDTYGHAIGDDLLIQFANKLKHLTRQQDVVARIGGDEFVVLLKNLGDSHEEADIYVRNTLKRFEVEFNTGYPLKGMEQLLICKPSIGFVILDNDIKSADEVLKQADSKMYEQKKRSKINNEVVLDS